MANQLSNEEIAEFVQKHHRRGDLMVNEVVNSYLAARAADKDPRGWGPSGFTETVLQPLYREFRAACSRTADRLAIARLCLDYRAQFRRLEKTPQGERESRGFAARSAAIPSAPPAAPTFDPAALLGRLAQNGVTLSLQEGALAVHGRLHPQVREMIAKHRRDLTTYLEQPAELIR